LWFNLGVDYICPTPVELATQIANAISHLWGWEREWERVDAPSAGGRQKASIQALGLSFCIKQQMHLK